MKTILEALRTRKVIRQGFSELKGFICDVCGDKLDYKELPEHAQMTGHDAPMPVFTALK